MRYPVMTEKHLADRWQVSLHTLRRWRLDGGGPVWHKLFRHVRYHEADVLEFEQRGAQFLMTLLGIDREYKPADKDVDAVFDAQGNRYLTAKDIAEAASLPAHIFQDRAERSRKQIPHLMLGGNLRFSLPAILAWEVANSVQGNTAEAADHPSGQLTLNPALIIAVLGKRMLLGEDEVECDRLPARVVKILGPPLRLALDRIDVREVGFSAVLPNNPEPRCAPAGPGIQASLKVSNLAGTFCGLTDSIEHRVKALDERHQICVVSRVHDPLTVLIPMKQRLIVVEGAALGPEAP
jgi:hypothetical protein